jgi:hypothetical protein
MTKGIDPTTAMNIASAGITPGNKPLKLMGKEIEVSPGDVFPPPMKQGYEFVKPEDELDLIRQSWKGTDAQFAEFEKQWHAARQAIDMPTVNKTIAARLADAPSSSLSFLDEAGKPITVNTKISIAPDGRFMPAATPDDPTP